MLAALPFFHAHPVPQDYFWGAVAGLCGGAGLALLYHALSIGKMGVVSPITAVLAAAVPVLVSGFLGERFAPTQLAGIVLALIAIVMISLSFDGGVREIATRGVREAVASGIILGGFYIFLAHTHKEAGLHSLVAARAASVILLASIGAFARVDLRPSRAALPTIVLAGALDMTANVCYLLATFSGTLAIAAVLTSLYPASTVFLASVVLRERLGRIQWFGVAFALAGVVLIALP